MRALAVTALSDEIASVADLRALDPPATAARAFLGGYYEHLDGGGGEFRFDPTATADDDGGLVFKPDSLAPEDPGRWLRIRVRDTINVKWFGARGDWLANQVSPNDDADAFYAAMAAASPPPPGDDYPYPGGTGKTAWPGLDILVPEGNYFLSRSLRIDKSIHLRGVGTMQNPKTVLRFAEGVSGLVFRATTGWADATFTGEDTSTDGTTSDGARVSNLCVWGKTFYGLSFFIWAPNRAYNVGDIVKPDGFYEFGYAYRCVQAGTSDTTRPAFERQLPPKAQADGGIWSDGQQVLDGTAKWELIWAHGIQLVQGVELDNVFVANFPGNGISVIGTASGITPSGNLWRLFRCKSCNNGGSGLYVLGNDSSAGGAKWLDCQGNWGYGIFDRSFLGNTYDNCHGADNVWGHYYGNGLFTGCYAEGQDTPVVCRGRWVTGVANGCGFTDFKIVDWAPGMTLTGPTWVRPSVKIGPDSQPEGLVFYAESGTTGMTEPDWNNSRTRAPDNDPRWFPGPTLRVDDNTVANAEDGGWKCIGIGTPSTGLFESDNLQGPTMSPYSIDMGRGRGEIARRLYFGGTNETILGLTRPAIDGDVGFNYVAEALYVALRYQGTLGLMYLAGAGSAESNTRVPYQGAIVFPTGFFLRNYVESDGNKSVNFQVADAEPDNTTHPGMTFRQGDRIFNRLATAGGPEGWVCVTTGTLGTGSPPVFKTFGSIAA